MSTVIWEVKLKFVGNFKIVSGIVLALFSTCLCAATKPPEKNYVSIAHQMVMFNAHVHRVLFVPDHAIKDVLLGLIMSEKEMIIGAHYRLSDKDVIQALIDAKNRKVHVELILDQGALLEKYQKIDQLKKAGIIIHVPKSSYLMHNKFFLFQKSLFNKSIIWSGSANITGVGLHKNCENVLVWENAMDYKLYKQQFEQLKNKRSVKKSW